jgi:exodeoxyribonuclease V alpha subunit
MWSRTLAIQNPENVLRKSRFRSSFYLSRAEKARLRQKSVEEIAEDIYHVIRKRIVNPSAYGFIDGKQTPYSGIIFKAQHATATCCRKCIEKWYHIPRGQPLKEEEAALVLKVIVKWLVLQISR